MVELLPTSIHLFRVLIDNKRLLVNVSHLLLYFKPPNVIIRISISMREGLEWLLIYSFSQDVYFGR